VNRERPPCANEGVPSEVGAELVALAASSAVEMSSTLKTIAAVRPFEATNWAFY